jgi:hypothetical protein
MLPLQLTLPMQPHRVHKKFLIHKLKRRIPMGILLSKIWLMIWLSKFGSVHDAFPWVIVPRIARGKLDVVFASDMVTFGKIVLIGSKANLLNGLPNKILLLLMNPLSVQT